MPCRVWVPETLAVKAVDVPCALPVKRLEAAAGYPLPLFDHGVETRFFIKYLGKGLTFTKQVA